MNIKDINEIKKLVRLMSDSDLTELTFEQKDGKLTLKRERALPPTFTQQTLSVPPALPTPAELNPTGVQNETTPTKEATKNQHTITAPLVGTYYAAPNPESEPFIEVGDKIKKGQVLCIIEAMKLMNEIESDVDGTITEILCENASPVEYGTSIVTIKIN